MKLMYVNVRYRNWGALRLPRRGYSTVTLPTKLVKEVRNIIKTSSGARYRSMTELVSDALEEKLSHLKGVQVVSVAEVSPEDAVRLVTEYLEKKPGSHYPSDIANVLGLDLELVFEVTSRLLREHVVELAAEKELAAR